jgi:glutaredoxin-related protein
MYLSFCLVGSAAVNGIQVSPKDVLMWLTGSTHIPACGFHKSIDVDFGSSTIVNTCALCLTLEVKRGMRQEDVVEYYTSLLINSQTFTKE